MITMGTADKVGDAIDDAAIGAVRLTLTTLAIKV